MNVSITAIATWIGILIAAVGAYYAYQQYSLSLEQETAKQPNVVLCLNQFSYERIVVDQNYSKAEAKASFRLVNKGATAVTVIKADFNPTGIWQNGKPGGLSGLEATLNQPVPAYGAVDVTNLVVTMGNKVTENEYWIETPEAVNVKASWANGSSPYLKCIPSAIDGGWACGYGDGLGIAVEQACT